MTPEQIQAAFDRRTIERIPPEYHGREECLWRPDYSRPVEIIPPNYRTADEWAHNLQRFYDWQAEQRQQMQQWTTDRAEAARIAAAPAEDVFEALEELKKWAK